MTTPALTAQPEPELIVILKDTAQAATPSAEASTTSAEPSAPAAARGSLQDILGRHGASMHLLFGPTMERVRQNQEQLKTRAREHHDPHRGRNVPKVDELPDMAKFHRVHAHPDRLEQLASELRNHHEVEAAYVKPAPALPLVITPIPAPAPAPAVTPSFQSQQLYLGPAPVGFDALYAQTIPGGLGDGINVIDCENGWLFTHEDLLTNKGGCIAGTNSPDDKGTFNHGTAVAGVICGDNNNKGVLGMTPNVFFSGSAWAGQGTVAGVTSAAAKLNAGDILLLEVHFKHPNAIVVSNSVDNGFMPYEWWPDQLLAVQAAVMKGIIVVEAAGNGYQNYDNAVYNTALAGFPAAWKNPLNMSNPQSGAIIVGAGNPPPGTHNTGTDSDRSICYYSNYGARVDCQGWGLQVTTTGYGDLQPGDPTIQYTNTFNGTSSASPCVVGALAAVQGILKKASKPLLTPAAAQSLVRTTGSPQQDGATGTVAAKRIGNRPDCRAMIAKLGVAPVKPT